jgi:hypothetical protein
MFFTQVCLSCFKSNVPKTVRARESAIASPTGEHNILEFVAIFGRVWKQMINFCKVVVLKRR